MLRKILIAAFVFFHFVSVAQVKSPEEFLGYGIGTRFTPHWKVVSYFEHISAAATSQVRLEKYGETYEGRPLLLAFVSSNENIRNLESIRQNNLRLANLNSGNAVETSAPAIVWLSYNVHGNEASSTEAAMLTIHALLDPGNLKAAEWLKNTVVVIDPCINPDGRDRYVNWYNSVVGKNYDPKLDAREHREPWPGGRVNHYYFDLNRDWAWQTQVESQHRIKAYKQWMPQVHVDFHEQFINNPYYFAPAAQPYHEVITPWQRDFQVTLGKNHAKYFDQNGWLYFTREVFDLFYPSYGDTYPTYNGAIGMTYEQAGHSLAGLGVITNEDDTLTLHDRAIHHFTTGMSTIEVSASNAGRLIKEFRKYFNDALTAGIGDYKTFVVKNPEADRQRIGNLVQLLDRNGISYEIAGSNARSNLTGFNYITDRDESFLVEAGDLLIHSQQPRSAMVKVLFEPRSKLVDSATYDITAWSLPYVYGLKAYATRVKPQVTPGNKPAPQKNSLANSYGYVLPWAGTKSAKALGEFLKKGIRVRYAEQPFETGGQRFGRGSLIVLRNGNDKFQDDLPAILSEIADANDLKVSPVSTGFVDKGFDFGSGKVHYLKAPKIALLSGEGTSPNAMGEVWHFFDQEIDYPVTLINVNDIPRVDLDDYDVLIMASGNYRFLNEKSSADDFRDWISKGGKVVAIEGAVSQFARLDWGLKSKKPEENNEKKDTTYDALKTYEVREKDFLQSNIPGSIYKVELDNTHPLAFGYPNYYYTLKQDDNMYEFIKEGGWNVGVIKKRDPVAGFVGSRLKDKLKDGLIFGVQEIGSGQLIYLADNIMFRNFWENGKLLLCNAVFLVGQ